jgi:O-antigen/teichoic acid export membrane protein
MDSTTKIIETPSVMLPRLNGNLWKLLRRAEIDRAVLFGIVTRIWSLVASPLTAILIATKFTAQLQGYYYTFASLVALQVFVELGLGTVIVQFASHEWSKLSLDENGRIIGDNAALSRLTSLAGIAAKWYLTGAAIAALGLAIGGYLFFEKSSQNNISWIAPWLTLSFLTAVTICLVPVWSLLEGCNQVSNVYTCRFIQSVCVNISTWFAILAGAKLWTATISSIVTISSATVFFFTMYRQFLKTLFFTHPAGPRIEWRAELLPMQWRIALSWLSGYFVFYFFTPVLFKYRGPVAAGQMGMTLSLASVLTSITFAWIAPRAPRFGILIAQKDYKQLDALFWRLVKIVSVVTSLGAASIWAFVYILNKLAPPLASRILPPLPAGFILLATAIIAISFPFSNYLRAHKKEPLLFVSVLSGILIGSSNIILGKYFGTTAMAAGYLVITIFVIPLVILVWHRCRTTWHIKTTDHSILT